MSDYEENDKTIPHQFQGPRGDGSQFDSMGNIDDSNDGENIFASQRDQVQNIGIKKMNTLTANNSRGKRQKTLEDDDLGVYNDELAQPMIPNQNIQDEYPTEDVDEQKLYPSSPNKQRTVMVEHNEERDFLDKQKTIIRAGTFVPKVQDINVMSMTDVVQDEQESDDDNEGFKQTFKDMDVEDDQIQAQRKDYEPIEFQDTMNEFVQKYGSTIGIAGKVVLDSKFFPLDTTYCVQVLNYTQPTTNQCVHTHLNQGGTVEEQNFNDLYSEEKYNKKRCVLRILHAKENSNLETVKEVLIPGARKIQIQFSPCCEYLAIFWKQSGKNAINRLALYKIGDEGEEIIDRLLDTFDEIERFERIDADTQFEEDFAPNINFNYHPDFNIDDSLFFLVETKKIKFCVSDSQYLVCYNKNEVTILSIYGDFEKVEDRIVHQFTIDEKLFEGIFHLQIDSLQDYEYEDGLNFRCEVACLSAQSNSVVVFDIKKDQEGVDQNNKAIIIQEKDDTENMNVKISHDFSKVVFCHHDEFYLLTETHKCPNTHFMTIYNNKETMCHTCGKEIQIGENYKTCQVCTKEKENNGIIEQLDQCLDCQNKTTTALCDDCEFEDEKLDSCQNENCSIEKDQPILFIQTKILWMHGKMVKQITHAGNSDFLFISCKAYDDNLKIESSCYQDFKIQINRKIEPNIIKVFDSVQQHYWTTESDPNLRGIGSNMRIVSMRDDEFFIDEVNPLANYMHMNKNINNLDEDDKNDLLKEGHLLSVQRAQLKDEIVKEEFQDESQLQGFSCYTPFLTLAETDNNYQLIYNLNDPSILHRIELPSDVKRVIKSWISETLDLFILCLAGDIYQLYMVDLDDFKGKYDKKDQRFRIQFLMSYEQDNQLGTGSPLIDFHVRGSSKKEKINLNKKIMVFFMHEKGIFYWNEKMTPEEGVKLVKGEADRDKSQIYSYFDRQDDENLFIAYHTKRREDNISEFKFDQIILKFNEYRIQNRHIETEYLQEVKSFAYDYAEDTLIMLTKPVDKNSKSKLRIKIMDLDTDENKNILNMQVKNPELIGRLKSQLFFLVNGHIYYNNSVIKIRYDLLRKNAGISKYQEQEIFDYYEDIVSLEKNERVLAQMPVSQHNAHRLIFMTKNKKSIKRSRIIVLPYLHERRLHFAKQKQESEYFQTAQRYKIKNSAGDHIGWKYWLVNMNLSDSKYYVYSLNGVLEKRVNFKLYIAFYGKPKAVSNNGQVFLFKKDIKLEDGTEDKMLSILWLTPEGFFKMKTFKIRDAITNYIETMEQEFEGDQKELEQFNEAQNAL